MKTIKLFYNSLDFLNLIFFWGIIIVIVLIILFLILYFHKKKNTDSKTISDDFDFDDVSDIKIKNNSTNMNIQSLSTNTNNNYDVYLKSIPDDDIDKVNEEINTSDDTFEIPILKRKKEIQEPSNEKKYNVNIEKNITIENNPTMEPIVEHNDITIERHIVEPKIEEHNYNIVIEKNNNIEPKEIIIEKHDYINNANIEPSIETKNITIEKENNTNKFTFEELVKKDNLEEKPKAYQRNVFREMNSRNQTSPIGIIYEKPVNEIEEYKESLNDKKDTYLEDVYSSLSEATVPDKVELTEYERKQEEDAVISYQELLKKRDTINYDKEEDVVISYGELLNRNSRLYNITEEEKDKEFLSELKEFRKDL